jgi:hypothetical protein
MTLLLPFTSVRPEGFVGISDTARDRSKRF